MNGALAEGHVMRGALQASLALATFLDIGSAAAQVYPVRPITVANPFPAGAPLDTVARIVGERMRMRLGQPLVIENIAGAGGTIAVARVTRAVPDGYTISIGNFSSHVLAGAIYQVQYDALKDLQPISLLASNPQLIISKNALPANDLPGLIAWLKANPDKASAGTAGPGSVSHVSGVFFQRETGTRFQFVPYRGVNLAQQDLIGGQLDLLFDQAPSALPSVRAGKIKAYAVTAKTRLSSAPNIPTVAEAGVPQLGMSIWSALWAPKGTPQDVIAKLNAAAADAMADPVVRDRLGDLGLDIPPREQQTPEALGALHKAEIEKWWPIIRSANIKLE
jgi:tripartite-type tricarboxylate transporter receptor subunit TctC